MNSIETPVANFIKSAPIDLPPGGLGGKRSAALNRHLLAVATPPVEFDSISSDDNVPAPRSRRLRRIIHDSDDEIETDASLRIRTQNDDDTTSNSSAYELYEARLRQYVPKLLSRPGTELSESFLSVLPTRSAAQWAEDISAITLPEAKLLLGAAQPPTKQQLLALPTTTGDYNPGVYYGVIQTPSDEEDTYGYLGSATAPSEGLCGRILQHQNPSYRTRYMSRGHSLHYSVLDEPGKDRYGDYRQLCRTEFASGESADVFYTRTTCILAEQLYMSWLKTHSDPTMQRNPWLAELSPWYGSLRRGLNGRLPIAEGIPGVGKEIAPLTPQERNDRARDHQRFLKSLETVEQREGRQARDARYHQEVMKPVIEMRKNGVAQAEIKKFQDAHRKMMHAERPKGGYTYETATPRTEQDRDLDLNGTRRPGKASALHEISANTPPVKRLKMEDSSMPFKSQSTLEYRNIKAPNETSGAAAGQIDSGRMSLLSSANSMGVAAVDFSRGPLKVQTQPRTVSERAERGHNCLQCKKSKVKCVGGPPCVRCEKKNLKCEPQ